MTDAMSTHEAPISTPLRRLAGRLRGCLPPHWQAEVVDMPARFREVTQPTLRIRTA